MLILGNQRQQSWVRETQREDKGHETKHRILGVRKDDFRITITLVLSFLNQRSSAQGPGVYKDFIKNQQTEFQ